MPKVKNVKVIQVELEIKVPSDIEFDQTDLTDWVQYNLENSGCLTGANPLYNVDCDPTVIMVEEQP